MSKAFSLDFETLSLRPNAMLLSVGVVLFDPDKVQTYEELRNTSPTFEFVFDPAWQVEKYGRHACLETADWWAKQSPLAYIPIFNAKHKLEFKLGMKCLHDWIKGYSELDGAKDLWVKGATADGVWFEDSMRAAELESPIHYRNIKCLRVRAADTDVACPVVPSAIPHNALSDALVQAMWVQRTQQKINKWRYRDADEGAQVPCRAA